MSLIIGEKFLAPNTLLCAVREKPVLFEMIQKDEPEADVLFFEECKPEGMQGKLNASNSSLPRVCRLARKLDACNRWRPSPRAKIIVTFFSNFAAI